MKEQQNYLWQFYWDCGRQGSVSGLFVATESEVREVIGSQVYFGEILGKHSEVYGTLDEVDLTKIDIEPEVIEKLIPHLGYSWSGYNPLEYLEDNEEVIDEDDYEYEEDEE